MCLAVPGRVLSIVGSRAKIDFAGVEKIVLIDLLPDIRPGEYVLVHAGFAIQRLDEGEAGEILDQLKEIENTMRNEDPTAQS